MRCVGSACIGSGGRQTEGEAEGAEENPLDAQSAGRHDARHGAADRERQGAPEPNVGAGKDAEVEGLPPRQLCLRRNRVSGGTVSRVTARSESGCYWYLRLSRSSNSVIHRRRRKKTRSYGGHDDGRCSRHRNERLRFSPYIFIRRSDIISAVKDKS